MSTVTETQYIDTLTQPKYRLTSNKAKRFLLPQEQESDNEDHGLVMRLDSTLPSQQTQKSVPVPAKLCGQAQNVANMALSSASLIQKLPETVTKRINKLYVFIQTSFLTVLLYSSLMLLGVQAITIVYLLASAVLPLGLWFLLTCGVILGSLYCHTSNLGFAQIPTPPPTPSHSSASLSSFSS